MTKKRVTVDFDEESYYLDGEYWESWDNYGEEMADKINILLNELNEEKCECENEIARLEMIISKLKNNDFENYEKKIQELNKENESLNETIKFIFRIQRQRLSKLQKKRYKKTRKVDDRL